MARGDDRPGSGSTRAPTGSTASALTNAQSSRAAADRLGAALGPHDAHQVSPAVPLRRADVGVAGERRVAVLPADQAVVRAEQPVAVLDLVGRAVRVGRSAVGVVA